MFSWIRQYPLVIGSLLFSIVLWLWVHLGAEFQLDIEVPLHITPPAQKAVGPTVPGHINATVRASGWKLLALLVSEKPECLLNVSSVDRTSMIVTSKTIVQSIALPEGVQTLDVAPDTLTITFEEVIERTLAVQHQMQIHLRKGFGIIGAITTEPDSVSVRGARSLVEKLTHCSTARLDVEDVHAPVTMTLPFDDRQAHLLSYSAPQVTVHADVQALAEIRLDNIPIEVRSAPNTKHIVLLPTAFSVTVRGGVQLLSSLTRNDIVAGVEYRAIALDTTGRLRPVVFLPKGIELVKQEPDYVQFVIRNAF